MCQPSSKSALLHDTEATKNHTALLILQPRGYHRQGSVLGKPGDPQLCSPNHALMQRPSGRAGDRLSAQHFPEGQCPGERQKSISGTGDVSEVTTQQSKGHGVYYPCQGLGTPGEMTVVAPEWSMWATMTPLTSVTIS